MADLNPPYQVTLLGDINADVFMQIPHYPQPGEDSFTEDVHISPGGSAANTAIVLSRLGVPVQLVARTGDDLWADLALGALNTEGVSTRLVQRDPQRKTGMIFLPVTPDGERTMFSYRGANSWLETEDMAAESLAGSRILHLSGYAFLEHPQKQAAWQALATAESLGVEITLDVGVEPAGLLKTEGARLFPRLSLIILGLDEARTITGETEAQGAISALLQTGVRLVALTQGGDGCWLANSRQRHKLPGFRVAVVDSTGAGDAFGAGLLFGMLHQLSLPAAGILANALGALAVTQWGGGPALPRRHALVRFLQEQLDRDEEPVPGWQGILDELLYHVN